MRELVVLLLFVYVLVSCNTTNDPKVNDLSNIASEYLGKQLGLPDSLALYSPFTNCDSTEYVNSDLKIYSHINASCGACIGQIKKWDSYAKQTKAKVFLILSSEDNFFMFKYLCDSMVDMRSFQHPFFFDTQNKFVSLNPFMKNSVHFETVLTDRKNNILLMGNPILSKKIKDLYETTIRENHEKNILNEFVY